MVGKGFTEAAKLVLGDVVKLAGDRLSVVGNLRRGYNGQIAYNLTVANDHTYFVGRSRAWVHNCADKFKWGNPRSIPTYGHAFLSHGQSLKPQQLIDRASNKGHQIGQWMNNQAAADFIADIARGGSGVYDVPLPSGLGGRSFLGDGTELVSDMARVVVNSEGSITTAFPYNSLYPN